MTMVLTGVFESEEVAAEILLITTRAAGRFVR